MDYYHIPHNWVVSVMPYIIPKQPGALFLIAQLGVANPLDSLGIPNRVPAVPEGRSRTPVERHCAKAAGSWGWRNKKIKFPKRTKNLR